MNNNLHPYLLALLVILSSCTNNQKQNNVIIETDKQDFGIEIIDLSQKQLKLYNQHVNTDSVQRVKIFRDSLYYPYQEVWNGYLGNIETFDAVVEHYGIKNLDQLIEKNKLFYSNNNNESLLSSFFRVRAGMLKLTGFASKGKWYLLYGPGIANLGGVGDGVMFIDFNFPGNKDLPSVINWFPHELNHQIYANQKGETIQNVLELCIDEGFAVYVNKLYWNTLGEKEDYSLAMSLNYSAEELINAENQLDFIRNYFEENHLSTDNEIKNKFGSRNVKIKENLPGAIGYLIGFKIVESYIDIYGKDSWKDIYILPSEEILRKSNFLKN